MTKLKKPQKVTKTYYDYHEVAGYLEKKHKKDFRDYGNKYGKNGDENAPYLNFWHFICENNEVHNGGFIFLPERSDHHPKWIDEILGYFEDFLGDDYNEQMRVSW